MQAYLAPTMLLAMHLIQDLFHILSGMNSGLHYENEIHPTITWRLEDMKGSPFSVSNVTTTIQAELVERMLF